MDEIIEAPVAEAPVVPTEAIITEHSTMALTAWDRCEDTTRNLENNERITCNAQAYARVQIPYTQEDGEQALMEMFFCGHHLEENLDALRKQALSIDDYRPSLIPVNKPMGSY